jgi:outer membrane protein assembly factor BamD
VRRSIQGLGHKPLLFTTLMASALPLPLTGCDKPEPRTVLTYTADAKRAYESALEEFNAHNWFDAQNLMREVKRKYGYSKYARLAELRLADADFEQDKFADAIRQYKQFVHDHRSDVNEVSYARSRIAEAQYREISDSLLLPSGDELDQAASADAYKELRGYLHDYPDAKESSHMRELLEDVTGRLIRHELYVARFYLNRDNYEAAVSRILYALKNYATVTEALRYRGLEPEALVLLGETYLKMHKWREAREAFVTVLQRYATSAETVQAKNFLEHMRERGV